MENSSAAVFQNALANAAETLGKLRNLETAVSAAADLIVDTLANGRKLLVCGNGGSAADAADFCTEFVCRFDKDRRPYPAMNLAQDGSVLTATGNDYGFEEIFARQIRAFGQAGDLVIAISTSGQSKNIQRALAAAKSAGLKAIALLGRDGGACAGVGDVELIVPGAATARIQEAHKFLLHVFCEICEQRLPTR
jgi:D-sedoheptulose 7-phosphate isomerase